MREVLWRALARVGIRRDDPSTWTKERPEHLQHLKSDPAFRAVGSQCTVQAIDEALEGQAWTQPKDWGAFFLVFPDSARVECFRARVGTSTETTSAGCRPHVV